MDIKLKRHYKVIIFFIFTIFFFGLVIGETMIVPYSSGGQIKVSANPNNIENSMHNHGHPSLDKAANYYLIWFINLVCFPVEVIIDNVSCSCNESGGHNQ